MELELNKIYLGDSLEVLKTFPSESVDCVVTSPPYWGLRDYGTATWEGGDENCDHKADVISKRETGQSGATGRGSETTIILVSEKLGDCQKCGAKRIDQQLGLEKTPEEYVAKLVEIFKEVKRVLKKEGTCWLNLGDSYNGSGGAGYQFGDPKKPRIEHFKNPNQGYKGLKPKDLVGIPWRVAFALQADGWYLRQDIIWAKPNPMPESVTDRCTKSHEYIFLLTKSPKYYFDNEAIREPNANPERTNYTPGSRTNGENKDRNDNDFAARERKKLRPHGVVRNRVLAYNSKENEMRGMPEVTAKNEQELEEPVSGRNKRSVWTVTTKPFREAHFATFPEELITPMIKTTRPDALILDPFMGAGTTAWVAKKLGRRYVGIELSPAYCEIANRRIKNTLF